MQVVLHVTNGKSNVRQVQLRSDTLIGRSTECYLRIASLLVSRQHCQITVKDSRVSIRDLGSSNGTFVNGRQIPKDKSIDLLPGSLLIVGPVRFVVQFSPKGGLAPPLTPETAHPEPTPAEDDIAGLSTLPCSEQAVVTAIAPEAAEVKPDTVLSHLEQTRVPPKKRP
jgi:predicted component of type VI protein secretion system